MSATLIAAALPGHVLQSLPAINQLLGAFGYIVAGMLFTHAGLHATHAVVAVVGALASPSLVVAVEPLRDHAAQAA